MDSSICQSFSVIALKYPSVYFRITLVYILIVHKTWKGFRGYKMQGVFGSKVLLKRLLFYQISFKHEFGWKSQSVFLGTINLLWKYFRWIPYSQTEKKRAPRILKIWNGFQSISCFCWFLKIFEHAFFLRRKYENY